MRPVKPLITQPGMQPQKASDVILERLENVMIKLDSLNTKVTASNDAIKEIMKIFTAAAGHPYDEKKEGGLQARRLPPGDKEIRYATSDTYYDNPNMGGKYHE